MLDFVFPSHTVHPVYFHSLLLVMALAFDTATDTLPDAALKALKGFPLINKDLTARQGAAEIYNTFKLARGEFAVPKRQGLKRERRAREGPGAR